MAILTGKISAAYHEKFTGEHYIEFNHWGINSKYRSTFTKIVQGLLSKNHGNVKPISQMTIVLCFPGPNKSFQNQGLLRIKHSFRIHPS